MSKEEIDEFNQEKGAERMKKLAVKHAVAFLEEAFEEGLVLDNQGLRDAVTLVMANLAETLYKKEGNVSDLESYAFTVHPFLKEHIEQVINLATHDMLTGALNKFGLEWYISEELDNIEAGLSIDLKDFKKINDRFGHQRGDEVLRDVAKILERALRDHDKIARIGGDEFFAVLSDKSKGGKTEEGQTIRLQDKKLDAAEIADIAAERIASELQVYLDKNPNLVDIGFDISVGSVVWRHGVSTEVLMDEADKDMYAHKKRQRAKNGQYR
ncbi:GGDEF domain-containing protein [Candidatus Saccharibacteria bacterium]|nr:GGDEF domain-containing protein [Candidatus Saccharibacteria bacterium]